jgi:BirA family transcriptional regulator, biotin operon repressor / biotin---[acetyl-CoA-carboxylase] ligase
MITPAIYRFEEVGSTNDIAIGMARHGASEGTVVIARSQTKGRGRRGRTWFTRPGESVIMSVLLRPDMPKSRYSELAFAAAVAVADCLQMRCGLEPALKWPNDVLVGDRKIAGILIEAERGAAIVGIGMNVLQNSFPHELAGTATSVAREDGRCTDIETLAAVILQRLFEVCALSFEEILERWRKYMWGLGRPVDVVTEDAIFAGTIAGIDPDGALLIDRGGIIRRVLAADAINVRTT